VAQIPDNILRRSAEARAKKEGRPVDEILAEMKGEAPAAEPDSSPSSNSSPSGGGAAAGGGGGQASTTPVAGSDSAAAEGGGQASTETAVAVVEDDVVIESASDVDGAPDFNGAKSDRLLTVIRAGEVQRIRSEPADRVTVWPHLLAIEFVALLVVLTLLIALSIFLDAPLLEFANFNEQPNPSKAPWYFLGLQELLAYFDPQIAGIIIPTFGAIAIAIIPYIDKNPSVKPSHRKLAIMIFTFFIMAAAVLTIFGSFFRGPGFNFTFPWEDGIFFDDLKSLLE
jgi:hypothetical protein